MKLTQENVCRVLKDMADRGATTKEILAALDQKKRQRAQLRKIIKELSKHKICYKRNNRYYLHDQSASPPDKKRRSKAESRNKTGKAKNNLDLLGLILVQSGQPTVFSFAQQKHLHLAKGSADRVMHGDLVRFAHMKGRRAESDVVVLELVERRITCLKGKVQSQKKGRVSFFPTQAGLFQPTTVTGSIALAKGQEADAWLDLSTFVHRKGNSAGTVRLIPDKMPQSSPVLEAILAANRIPDRFPASTLQACELLPRSVRLEKKSNRVDLRHFPFVTIDGEDAKDFDDAIYAEREGENYRIWVSIADVADYVPAQSAIDREAFSRGTSTYLPGKVYPMLPETLSNHLCSLKEGLNRKTVTCESLLDNKGKTLSSRIYPSLNRIRCRLTYPQVDRFYSSGSIRLRKGNEELPENLQLYREVARLLRSRRIKDGFIDFQLPETEFVYDRENRVVDLIKSYQTEAMQVIEQFMLLANENVAKFCDKNNLPIVWRNHPQPLPEKLIRLRKMLWNSQIKLTTLKTGKDFNLALGHLQNSPDKDYLEYAMLRSMSLATYGTKREGHFGIAADYYCHFTSPIRRYPDLLVHRTLHQYFQGKSPAQIPEFVAVLTSERERLSTAAERSANRLFKLFFMADKIGELFEARISGFIKSGLFVEIEYPYVEGFVSFATIRDDHYELVEESQCIHGKHNRTRFTIGKKLTVLLTGLDWRNLSPEFDWIYWKEDV